MRNKKTNLKFIVKFREALFRKFISPSRALAGKKKQLSRISYSRVLKL